jgi:hypothetical protein
MTAPTEAARKQLKEWTTAEILDRLGVLLGQLRAQWEVKP